MIAIARTADEPVGQGEALVVLEAMKMEHEIVAEAGGVVRRVEVEVGETVEEGQLLAVIEAGATTPAPGRTAARDADQQREDLEAVRRAPRARPRHRAPRGGRQAPRAGPPNRA